MKVLRSKGQFLCVFMAVLTLIISIPHQSVLAALVNTEAVKNSVSNDEAREQLHQFLAREDVRAALIAYGIDPMEAKQRVDTLSDNEVLRISDQIDRLPAGGAVEALLFIIILTFLILVILDLAGVTDIFTFIKSQK